MWWINFVVRFGNIYLFLERTTKGKREDGLHISSLRYRHTIRIGTFMGPVRLELTPRIAWE